MADSKPEKSVPRRLLAVASSGGHWIELVRLSPSLSGYDTLYATSAAGASAPSGSRAVAAIPDASRSNPLRLVKTALALRSLISRFRPHLIVTTGAAPGLLAIGLGKLSGCRTVWIDSIANAERLSLSGRLARSVATVRLTQWEHLADAASGVRYLGRVI